MNTFLRVAFFVSVSLLGGACLKRHEAEAQAKRWAADMGFYPMNASCVVRGEYAQCSVQSKRSDGTVGIDSLTCDDESCAAGWHEQQKSSTTYIPIPVPVR